MIKQLFGSTPALLADFANGIFAIHLAALITKMEIIWWYYPIGVLLAMLPDIDAIPELIRRGRVSASAQYANDHRTFLHFPIVSIPLFASSAFFFGFWGWVVLLGVTLHLVNDFYGTGWGLRLLWPLNKSNFKLLGRQVNRLKYLLIDYGDWGKLSDSERKLRLIVCWRPVELPNYINKWGIDNWIPLVYYRLNFVSVIEYSLFALACLLVGSTLL